MLLLIDGLCFVCLCCCLSRDYLVKKYLSELKSMDVVCAAASFSLLLTLRLTLGRLQTAGERRARSICVGAPKAKRQNRRAEN